MEGWTPARSANPNFCSTETERKSAILQGKGPGVQGKKWPEHRCLDGPIRANRFADSRASHDSCESFQGSRTGPPFFCESGFGGLKIANRGFEAVRANRSHYENRGFSANRFARIASIRVANRRAI